MFLESLCHEIQFMLFLFICEYRKRVLSARGVFLNLYEPEFAFVFGYLRFFGETKKHFIRRYPQIYRQRHNIYPCSAVSFPRMFIFPSGVSLTEGRDCLPAIRPAPS
jgi:hypothetical protein